LEIIPAIDIKEGKCVRLYQGDYNKVTVYSSKPEEVAVSWQEQGAARLHIVDLEAAASGDLVNFEVIKKIRKAAKIPLQVGGGLRTMDAVKRLVDAGIDRFVLGTAAVENPEIVKEVSLVYGDRAIVGIDARDGKVQIKGWLKSSDLTAKDMVLKMKDMGVRRFIITDISRDGTLTGPNFSFFEGLVKDRSVKFIASGGVAALEHIGKLKRLGFEGAIIGKALYSGDIKLKEALEQARNAD